jgi:hypothetical protein
MASDIERSKAFYADLLGWSYGEGAPEFGGYTSALVGGRQVAGLSPTMPGMEEAPHVWSVYLGTDDIEATDRAATAAGARQVAAPMVVGPLGSMAMWVDPAGAFFGAWQPGQHTGFDAVGEDGTVSWCDLMTADYGASKAFYAGLFGYTYEEVAMGGASYAMFSVPGGDRPAGGIGALDEDSSMTGWTVTFQHPDVDAAGAHITAAGGTVDRDPYTFDYGRLLIARGPDGEQFGLLTPAPAGSDG